MANTIKRNVIFVDALGSIAVEAVKPILREIIITPSANDSRFILKESVGGTTVLDIKITNTESRHIPLRQEIELSQIFAITLLQNVSSVILIGDWRLATGR